MRTKSAVPAYAGGTGTGSIRVASVPAGHVYVRHLSAPSGGDAVVRLADPVPREKTLLTGQWWPPVMLSPSWVLDHRDEFDVFHIQFGFDAQEASCLSELARALRSVRKPLVYTVHDLRNPHHADRRAYSRFGKGRHPAALNFGDCCTYAVASVAGEPLLCIGDDFARTDLLLVSLNPDQ